ncbi:hypothetical protein [Streptomyces indicus]|uniref:Uncharacterized protein n=1 Tax=Streptomyces indicus TaxID=417292 RepID=A0A1G9BVT3_9ACTN|nr:hypothetical protein [Streptomyces indicus]SDK43556.1 hypothetical protein SAMN05421806_107271 [Streptomyces indicus]
MSYEDELGEALRRAGEGFSTDQHTLVEGGHLRGRRMVRRRRAAVFGGAAAVAALAVTGAVAVPGLAGEGPAQPAAAGRESAESSGDGTGAVAGVGTPATGDTVTREQLIGTLTSLLPKGEVTESDGRGTDELPGPYARVVLDDGKGKGAVAISFNRVADPDGDEARSMTTCPDKVLVPHDACTSSTLEDGSRLMVFQGYVYPDRRAETKEWRAVLATHEGHLIDAMAHNAAAEKDAPVTRSQPPLSPSQLKALVTSDKWDPVFDAPALEKPTGQSKGGLTPGKSPADGLAGEGSGKDSGKGAAKEEAAKGGTADEGPGSGGDAAQVQAVRSTFLSLLPKGMKVLHQGGEGEYAYAVVDDGKGASLVQINVQPGMEDVSGELFGDAEELPGGILYTWRESGGDKGVDGSVMWTADTIRMDGLRVVVSAFNSGTQHDAPTRATPALTQEQLKSLATSPKWVEGQ